MVTYRSVDRDLELRVFNARQHRAPRVLRLPDGRFGERVNRDEPATAQKPQIGDWVLIEHGELDVAAAMQRARELWESDPSIYPSFEHLWAASVHAVAEESGRHGARLCQVDEQLAKTLEDLCP